uniref:CUB domain-containing protein n=1 Tax=Trichogramma kaykai TaxID=54128 RepID=A0ABD2XLM5_9HYME
MIFLYYVLLLLLPIVLSSGQQLVRNEDICGPHNGRRLYVELGERGVLRADNVSLVKNSAQLQQDGSASGNNNGGRPLYATTNSSHDQCSLELVTCPSCVISVVFRSINLQHHCGDGGATVDSPCRCDYVWISEPPYEDVSGTPFCGHYAPMAHRSNTRTLSIALLYSQSHSHAFSLEYTAERNRLILTGSNSMNDIAKSMNNTGGGTLASPFFPSRYPRDMGIEYIISCPTEAPVCRVRVLFSDFQVAAVSVMEYKADVNIKNAWGDSPVTTLYCNEGDYKLRLEIFKLLLENGADVTQVDSNVLNDICAQPSLKDVDLKMIQLLIHYNADVNIPNENGFSPIMILCNNTKDYKLRFKIFDLLLKNGADVTLVNNDGDTILHLVLLNSNNPNIVEAVELLLKSGVDVNIQNKNGYSALHLAVGFCESLKVVELLLKNGADRNIVNNKGMTALNFICTLDHIKKFYDWNGQRLDVSSGARFRPPIIVSTGPSLLVRFYANGGTGLGYKAFYSFVFTDPAAGGLATVQPVTDCGGYVENLGGTITMMDMVGDEGVRTYDCVWLIKPPKNFLHTKTHMYVKVISFAEMAGNTELIIKQGPTSALMPLEVLRHPVSQLQPPKLREHLAPVSNGFHVSLRGSFGPNSRLAIAYAAFSYIDCFAGSDFLCQNHRCISSQLNCDGFDHCGDSSDEPATCMHDMDMTIKDQKWHQSKANYYFPKIDRYPDLKTATMVFVISSLGLIIMISTLIIMLYRIGSRARQQRELQSRLRTISELLDGARIDEMSVNADEPPVYEAPPNYDEVIKLGMENETAAAARRKRARRTPSGGGRRSRSVPSQCSCEFESHLTINAYESPSNGNLGSDAPQSASSSSSTTAILPAGSESPPPPYVTPPKSASPTFQPDDNPQPGPSGLSSHIESSSTSSRSEANCRGTCRHRLERRNSSVSLPAASREASTERLTQDDNDDLLQQQQRIKTSENVLGAYNASSSSSPAAPADACAAPQLPRSSAASACTSTECAATCCSADADTRIEAPVRRGRGPPTPANVDASCVEGCLCEGACGCASLKRARALLRSVGASKTIDHESAVDPTTTTMTMTRTLTSPNVSAGTQAQRLRRQLFFAADDKNQADETTNILDRVPSSSSSSSTCLKRNYASCDLDNLYESIKVLDTYLAKRTATSQDRLGQLAKRRRSMAAMLFDDDLRQPSEDDAVFSTPMTMSRRESRDNEPRP